MLMSLPYANEAPRPQALSCRHREMKAPEPGHGGVMLLRGGAHCQGPPYCIEWAGPWIRSPDWQLADFMLVRGLGVHINESLPCE